MPVVNFASETVFEANTTSGNVSLTRAQLQTLVDGTYTSGGVSLSGDDILVLDVDLGERVAVSDIRYYFSSVAASGTVVSGINFYYKEYDSDPWSSFTTTAGAGYYTTTSGNLFPRLVRVVHTISGTGVSGTLHEYEVNSDDDIVDYGTDGTLIEKDLLDTPFGTSDPYSIPVYNDGDRTATAYVYVGNTDTDADDMLKISAAQNGTYVGPDDGVLINNEGQIRWNSGGLNNVSVVNDKIQLDESSGAVSYSSGWQKLFDNLDIDCRPAGIAWHPTEPFQSTVFYIKNSTMFKYELATGVHLSTGSTPRYVDSYNYGGANDLCYDPIGNRMYYFAWDSANKDHLYIYYYDLSTGLWTTVYGPYDSGVNNRYHGVAAEYFAYPGSSDSLDGYFEVGERYMILTISSGQSDTFHHLILRLSDGNLAELSGSPGPGTKGFQKETGDCASFPACYNQAHGTAIQYENLDNFPTATVAVIWSIAGSSDTYSYLNYYPITVSGGVTQNWQAIHHQGLPRDPNIDSWYYNDDFTNRSHFFWYEDETDKLVMTSSYNNDLYAIEYQIQNNLLWRRYIDAWAQGKAFFEAGCDSGWLFGRSKYYADYGRFWFMFTGYVDDTWVYFPVSWSSSPYETSGTYTTAVFKNIDPTYWRVKAEIPENTSINTSVGAIESTIEVRSSDTPPTGEDSQRYLGFVRDGVNNYNPTMMSYDGTELWRDTGLNSYTYYTYVLGCTMAMNEFYPDVYNSENLYAFFGWNNRRTGNYFNRLLLSIYDPDGNRTYYRTRFNHTSDEDYYRITNAIFASNNMIYATYRGTGTESDRIDVLDSTLYWPSTLEFTGDQSTLYSMCLAGADLEDLWIIKEDLNAVRRYNQNLQLQQTIDDITTGNLNGMCEDGEGGFFVGETQAASRKIHHYDENGTFVATYDLSSHINSIHRMKKDYEGGLWILDTAGEQIARFSSRGELIGKQSLLSPQGLASNPLGCWVMSEVYDRWYFVTPDVTIDQTNISPADSLISYDGDNWRGAWGQSVERGNEYIDPTYLTGDPHWDPSSGDLEWSEVGKDSHFLHHKKYHQARVTLRSDSSDTPIIEKIALPPTIELANIPPQGYRNAYMKTVVASGTQRIVQHGKIRTWFDMEE